jgi:hypothetical protein
VDRTLSLALVAALAVTGCAAGPHAEAAPAGAAIEAVPPAAPTLGGKWAQVRDACNGHAIGEVIFRPDGSFAVTWAPFETYVDYWGTYRFDAGTGDLTLAPDGGNFVPADVAGGHALIALAGDTFRFTQGSFGTNPTFAPCDAPFRRFAAAP